MANEEFSELMDIDIEEIFQNQINKEKNSLDISTLLYLLSEAYLEGEKRLNFAFLTFNK
ncbi:424_t:CDS:1, partial [Scutellospora calospora]